MAIERLEPRAEVPAAQSDAGAQPAPLGLGDLIDSPPEAELDRWTALARRITGAAVSALLVEAGDRLVVKSLAGSGGAADRVFELAAGDSVAACLCDLADVRAAEGPVPSYAQAPVYVGERMLGWLAIADPAGREWGQDELRALHDVAAAVSVELRLRLAQREAGRVRDLLASNNAVHQLIAQGAPLNSVFDELVRGIERHDPSVIACVVVLDRESSTLHPGSGPSLPPAWLAAIDGAVIGPNVGTCGAAAWSGRLTITEDIAEDPKWAPIRAPALAFGLRHCWSMPIKATDGDVLGTVAFYGRRPRRPRPEQLALLRDSARLAGIAIERHRTIDKLLHDARHDGLTGLANRTAIFEHLAEAIARARPGSHAAVLFVDLDGLKMLNDTLGHDRADEMLREIAARIASALRPADFVGRFGGDEFVVVAEDLERPEEAAEIGSRLLDVIAAPLPGPAAVVVTASIGIATLSDDAPDAREAIRRADSAMYAAKRAGRDRCRSFDGGEPVRSGKRILIARELKGAELRGEMRLEFQPVFDLGRMEAVGVEALLRWDSPTFGALLPAEFVPVAEDRGLIATLGAWVLRESCETVAAIAAQLGRPLELAVNVSAAQLGRPGFATSIRQTLVHAEFPAELLSLELTEAALLRPDAVTVRALDELKGIGVRIALDDFGAGYSSLAWLRRHPPDGIKIAPAFVERLPTDAADAAVVAGVISISRALGCTVTAEGVETEEQLRALRELGCERAQGHVLGYPVRPAELIRVMAGSRRPRRAPMPDRRGRAETAAAQPAPLSEADRPRPLAGAERRDRRRPVREVALALLRAAREARADHAEGLGQVDGAADPLVEAGSAAADDRDLRRHR